MHTSYLLLLQPFYSYLQFEKRYSQHTLISYQTDLEQFFGYLSTEYGAPELNAIKYALIRSWLAAQKNQGISARSINRKISSLKSFFKYQLKTGVIAATPMTTVITPKNGKRLPEFVQEKDLADLFQYLSFPEDWKGKTDRLVLELFYHSGMRLSELVNLKESQVDSSRSQIKIVGKGNKERVVPIAGPLVKTIEAYMAEKRKILEAPDLKHLFVLPTGKKLYNKYVYLAVKQYLGHVTTLNKKSPHILRHSFATHLTNNGANINAVKELLGHSSLAATQVYTHNSIEKLKEAYKKAHPKA